MKNKYWEIQFTGYSHGCVTSWNGTEKSQRKEWENLIGKTKTEIRNLLGLEHHTDIVVNHLILIDEYGFTVEEIFI